MMAEHQRLFGRSDAELLAICRLALEHDGDIPAAKAQLSSLARRYETTDSVMAHVLLAARSGSPSAAPLPAQGLPRAQS